MSLEDYIINKSDLVLVTGANGFIGRNVVKTLLSKGYSNIRCFVRPSGDLTNLNKITNSFGENKIKLFYGNLLSFNDCIKATKGVFVIFHVSPIFIAESDLN